MLLFALVDGGANKSQCQPHHRQMWMTTSVRDRKEDWEIVFYVVSFENGDAEVQKCHSIGPRPHHRKVVQATWVLLRGPSCLLSCISTALVLTNIPCLHGHQWLSRKWTFHERLQSRQPWAVERQLQRLLFSRLRQRLEANVSSPGLLTAGVDDEWAA